MRSACQFKTIKFEQFKEGHNVFMAKDSVQFCLYVHDNCSQL